jgi:GTPase SAR1 family protein
VSQAGEISKSDKDNESLENTLLVTDNQQLVEQINNQRDIIKNRYSHNGIRIIGDRGAGKTTFMTALSSLSQKNNEIPFEVLLQGDESQQLLHHAENILMQGSQLEPTFPDRLEEMPLYHFRISFKPSLFRQLLPAIGGKTIEMDISFREYPGEIFNDLRNNGQDRKIYSDYFDDCASVSKLLLLIDGTGRDDKGYKESFIRLSEEIANRLDNQKEVLKQYRIAVVISKCEDPSLWVNRHEPQELMSLKFWETHNFFQRWSQSWGCEMDYFACSSLGVIGNPPRPNFIVFHRNERGSIGGIKNPQEWKPFGLLAPIYWLHTGKHDPRLQQ